MADATDPATLAPTENPPSPAKVEATPATKPTITYDDFAKIEFRVATVLEAAPMPKSDMLLALQIDLGGQRRQILAGIKQHVDPATLAGRQIIVVANLAPRKMRGQMSEGMLLAATDAATGKVILLAPTEPVPAGSEVK